MRILIDNTILYAGGGVQVAISFLNDLKEIDKKNEYFILQSPTVRKSINEDEFPKNFHFYHFEYSGKFLIFKKSKWTKEMEDKIKPDIIFTTFGPSYHKSNYKKVVGFARGHILYMDSPYFKRISFVQRMKQNLLNNLHLLFFKQNSDFLIFETEDARRRFGNFSNIQSACVSNTINSIFYEEDRWEPFHFPNDKFRIIYVSAYYSHKNFEVIPSVIDNLIEGGLKTFSIVLTVNKTELNFPERYYEFIECLGKVSIEKLPRIYKQCQIAFIPTQLEIFSASFLEAMIMELPIVASDLPFAHDICGEAALYAKSTSGNAFATNILTIVRDNFLRESLIKRGKNNLQRFGSSMDRTMKYLEILKSVVQKENKNKN